MTMKFDYEYEFKVYGKSTMGLPMTPSHWIGAEYKPIKRIKVTCGGGMGGSVWFEYVDKDSVKTVDLYGVPMLSVMTWNGEKKIINPRYVVTVEDYDLMTATFYNERNTNFRLGVHDVHVLVNPNRRVELVNKM